MENQNDIIEQMKENAIDKKYDFMFVFDVTNGNPNGDPAAGGAPRIEPITGLGQVSSGCIKRKIRNYVELVKEGEQGYDIYIKNDAALETKENGVLTEIGVDVTKTPAKKAKGEEKEENKSDLAKWYMAYNYFDVRAFGAVLTSLTKRKWSGQLRGPVQISMATSVDEIIPQDLEITRQAITRETDMSAKSTEIGHKYNVPYGLYVAYGHISPNLAQKSTGFSKADLELLWEAILNMFEEDHSDMRGEMAVRKLIVFEHESKFGNAPAAQLFSKVSIDRTEDVVRNYGSYEIKVPSQDEMPKGVTVIEKI